MPTEAEGLSITSSPSDRSAAIGGCIAQIMQERPGISEQQAAAICISQADRAMGTRQSRQPGAVQSVAPVRREG